MSTTGRGYVDVDYEVALSLLNTGREVTVQCVSSDLVYELYMGVDEFAYLDHHDLPALWPDVRDEHLSHCSTSNSYVFLTPLGLETLLTIHSWVLIDDE